MKLVGVGDGGEGLLEGFSSSVRAFRLRGLGSVLNRKRGVAVDGLRLLDSWEWHFQDILVSL